MPIERRRVYYEGRVQGVGFRMTARRLASGFPVSGHVCNLPDGRVELVAQGDPPAVASFLTAVHREFGDMIRDIRVVPETPDAGAPPAFTIHYGRSTS
ncbi:acylphosphatase [Tundrisphaera sp. TA3]|uniref:acylphosphatase n=1 Tax=Tundrisphaera sp. TA3 TaxID=3435775 RepID=UPI003EC1162C